MEMQHIIKHNDLLHDVRPSRSCSQAREARAELEAITESVCASQGLAMASYAILSLNQHETNTTRTTSPRCETDQHKQTKVKPMHRNTLTAQLLCGNLLPAAIPSTAYSSRQLLRSNFFAAAVGCKHQKQSAACGASPPMRRSHRLSPLATGNHHQKRTAQWATTNRA